MRRAEQSVRVVELEARVTGLLSRIAELESNADGLIVRIAELENRLARYESRALIDRDALLERAKQLDSYAWSDFASIVAEQPVIK